MNRQQPEDHDDPEWRMTLNLLAAIFLLVLLAGGYWLVKELDAAKKAQDCLASGNRKCRQIDAR